MSVSLPSREVYSVDVPEIKGFQASFQYNFFTPDESVSDTGGVPTSVLERPGAEIDSEFVQYATTRAPRFVTFSFRLPRLKKSIAVSDVEIRDNVFSSNTQNGSLISDNLDKIVSEDYFSSENFVAVTFNDGEIDDKIHYLISGSHAFQMLEEQHDPNVSRFKAAQRLSSVTPDRIKPHFLFRSLTNPSRSQGARFFKGTGQRIFNAYFKRLKEVTINSQVNSRFLSGLTDRSVKDPNSQFSSDIAGLKTHADAARNSVLQRIDNDISETEFKTFIPFIDLKVRKTALHKDHSGAEIVGYIIDKSEVMKDGTLKQHDPIVIDNPSVSLSADFQIKYDSTYVYSVRTISQFTMPAIDDDDGSVAMIKALVSSKPSNKIYVRTIETTAPPPPVDVNFTWDYERINPITAKYDQESGLPIPNTGHAGSLLVHWAFPPNQQRDIKQFQVFRRKNVDHPFELIKVYDFDDSYVKFSNGERPDASLVEKLSSPKTFFFDDDFIVGDHDQRSIESNADNRHPFSSTYIYAIAAIDAHGYTSAFSAQYELWFDLFKNRLEKRLVCHSGSPKPYPNLYLASDLFVDTINVSGADSKRLKIYFNPEHYHLYDDQDRTIETLATTQNNGSYRLQFINVDSQKSVHIDIRINDQTRVNSRTLASNVTRFGPKRTSKSRKIITQ
jgi:hypothetical protein